MERKSPCDLRRLLTYILDRESHNKSIENSIKDKKVFYPIGNTGAGKTTFMLFASGAKLIKNSSGKYEAKSIPKGLEALQIGQTQKSCTVFINAVVHEDYVFLDGPGLNDTEGVEVDIANIVSMDYLFKRVPSLTPVLFIEYPAFKITRGSGVRQVMKSCLSMFKDDASLLSKHLILVITKLDSDVDLALIEEKFSELLDVDTEENTDELKDLLKIVIKSINGTIKKDRKAKMYGRIILFDPADDDLFDKIERSFEKVDPLEDPHENFEVQIPVERRNALENSLGDLKLSIPVWLKENNITLLAEHLSLLSRLAPSIPDVKSTYDYCARSLHGIIKKNLVECKSRFSDVLGETLTTNIVDVLKVLDQRNLLVNLKEARDHMESIDSVEDFDDWVLSQVQGFVKKSTDSNDFYFVGMNLEKSKNITNILSGAYPKLAAVNQSFCSAVEEKVKKIEIQITDIELCESNLDKIEHDLVSLQQAIDEVQKFLNTKCNTKGAILHINGELDKKQQTLSTGINSSPDKFEKSQIDDFRLIKIISTNKKLRSLLDEYPSKVESEESRSSVDIQSKSYTERRYQNLVKLGVSCAFEAIQSLKQRKNLTNALEDTSEKFILTTKAISELDFSIKEQVDLELTKTIISLEENINPIIEQIRNKIFTDKPDYRSVPELLEQLKSCKWIDKHSFNGNRVTKKEEEVNKFLTTSLKSLASRIQFNFKRGRYTEAEELYLILENDLALLDRYIPAYIEVKTEIFNELHTNLTNLYSVATSFVESSSKEPDQTIDLLASIDEYIASIIRTTELSKTVGCDALQGTTLRKLREYGRSTISGWINNIMTQSEPDFIKYCLYLDQLKQAQALENLGNNLSWYTQACSQCSTRIRKIEDEVKSNIENQTFDKIPGLIQKLEEASVLSCHLDWIMDTVSRVKDERSKAVKGLSNDIEDAFKEQRYSHCNHLINQIPKDSHSYKQSITFLKSNISQLQRHLLDGIHYTPILNESKSEHPALRERRSQLNQFVYCKKEFSDIIQDYDFNGCLKELYIAFDDRYLSYLKQIGRNSLEFDISDQLYLIEQQMNNILMADKLPRSKELLELMKANHNEKIEEIYKKISNLHENGFEVDSYYTKILENNSRQSEAIKIKKSFSDALDKISQDIKQSETRASAYERLFKLNALQTQFKNPDLIGLIKQATDISRKHVDEFSTKVDRDFEQLLLTWDINSIKKLFDDYKGDPGIINSFRSKLKERYQTLLQRPNLNELRSCEKTIKTIMSLHESFPSILEESTVIDYLKQYQYSANNYVKNLKTSVRNITSDEITIISSVIKIIFEYKNLEVHIKSKGWKLVEESELTTSFEFVIIFLGESRSKLDNAVGRCDFNGMYAALRMIESNEVLLLDLRDYLGSKSNDGSFSTLAATIKNCYSLQEGKKLINSWANELSTLVDQKWEAKDFLLIQQLVMGYKAGHHKQIDKLIPNFEDQIKSTFSHVEIKYEELSRSTEDALDKKDWKKFRDNYSILEKMGEVEKILGKSSHTNIKKKIESKIENISCVDNGSSESDIAMALANLAQLSQNIPQFKEDTSCASMKLINNIASGPSGKEKVYRLGQHLNNGLPENLATFGKEVVASNKAFSAVSTEIWKQKTQSQTIDWALGDDNGNARFAFSDSFQPTQQNSRLMWALDKCFEFCKTSTDIRIKWKKMYNTFFQEYKTTYDEAGFKGLQSIVNHTKSLAEDNSPSDLPKILANICVVWAIKRSGTCDSDNRVIPHPIQVLCFFRLLECKNRKYFNQLIEVLTGEGKSVILGVVSTYFALHGFDVSCICYSEYLSQRDYSDFKDVFDEFGISERISYSTISKMCEIMINKKGNVRQLAKQVIESTFNHSQTKILPNNRQSVLLIDEVDVFFGSDFYGNTYNPATLISNDTTYEILNFIYGNRKSVDFTAVSNSKHYVDLTNAFPKLKPLIDCAIRKMLTEVKEFDKTPERPIVINDTIFYKDQDTISSNKFYGYKTSFQYFDKARTGEIKDIANVKKNVGIYIGCGNFSFAEIPMDFTYKMGVSGTLRSLTDEEKAIVQSYGVERVAYAPSIYGGSRLNEKNNKKSSILILDTVENWFLRIVQHCQEKQQGWRAVLIFFENIEILNQFVAGPGKNLLNVQILEEKEEFKETVIKQATDTESVTICTRPFGRGVDFICRDPKTKSSGGVHVIQTFVASSEAEQIQIKGRAARQGDPGSHEFLLCHVDLVKYLGTKDGQPEHSGFKDYKHDSSLSDEDKSLKITTLRDNLYKTEVKEMSIRRTDAQTAHNLTKSFHQKLLSYTGTPASQDDIIDTLLKINQSVLQSVQKYHLFFCLDESGSMGGQPWADLMKAVHAFLTKRDEMCRSNGYASEDFVTCVNYASSARVIFRNEKINTNLHSKITFASGGTDFAAGLKMVHSEMKQANLSGFTPCLLFMSDGGSGNGEVEMQNLVKEFPSTKVFVIGFGSGCDRNKMTKMAQLGNGQFMFGTDGTQLKAEFETISIKISGGQMAL
eukprot:TRINITY_DN3246_c0_g1_i1.p1 TRINITY_DN3246_c0_g1~~TRINITY_DN3246_c0_g1_i1.p1  ORF type:complete len:2508 (+),score=513.73 TRINITY_DN3246_c0_g1_i1:49-7572(+)